MKDLDTYPEVPPGAATVAHSIVSVRGESAARLDDQLAVEEPLEIRLGGRRLSVTMRTPGHDEELVAGFLFTERIIEGPADLDTVEHSRASVDDRRNANLVNALLRAPVKVLEERFRRNFLTSSSCGVCGKVAIESILEALPPMKTDLTVPSELFRTLARSLEAAQITFGATGGLHAAGLFAEDGRLIVLREDIGRHNAVDKVIGHMLLADRLPLDRHILMVSGRASFEIMQKAAVARIPIVAAVSAPSSLAVQFAEACEMTLVGFLRDQRFNVYAGAHRLMGPEAPCR